MVAFPWEEILAPPNTARMKEIARELIVMMDGGIQPHAVAVDELCRMVLGITEGDEDGAGLSTDVRTAER